MNPIVPVRYQECSWYVKLWRFRHCFLIPFQALMFYRNRTLKDTTWKDCWLLSKDLAYGRMQWTYLWDDTKRQKLTL